MEALQKLESITAVDLYSQPEYCGKVLALIATEARKVEQDTSTAKGRALIASTAAKVARLKVHMDALGKELTAEWKAKSAAVDAERKRIRDDLDKLKDEIRKPLSDWEEAVRAKEKAEQDVIQAYESATLSASAEIKDWIERTTGVQHDAERVEAARLRALLRMTDALVSASKAEAEAAELAKLRAEAAERERIERETRIAEAAVAAERKRASEAEAAAERKREEEKIRAELALKRAEIEKEQALIVAKNAEREAAAKVEREKEAARLAAEKAAANKEKRKRKIEEICAGLDRFDDNLARAEAIVAGALDGVSVTW